MIEVAPLPAPTVLITGIAGSLGRAFAKKLLNDGYDIVGIDSNEWALAAFKQEFPDIRVRLADFDDWTYAETPCDTLIHCAAYKHVDLGEDNPNTFVENNVEKTKRLFAEACKHGVEILFISTDKAVEPISTYGFTKAIGERLAWYYGGQVARLGNILSSTGSVIPAWEEAIANNQPLRITDERMVRYVIEDFDAVDQIWQGFVDDKPLIVPNMGPEQRVMDIAADVLARHGYKNVADYEPGFTVIGIRPGEKLREKLKWDHE